MASNLPRQVLLLWKWPVVSHDSCERVTSSYISQAVSGYAGDTTLDTPSGEEAKLLLILRLRSVPFLSPRAVLMPTDGHCFFKR